MLVDILNFQYKMIYAKNEKKKILRVKRKKKYVCERNMFKSTLMKI